MGAEIEAIGKMLAALSTLNADERRRAAEYIARYERDNRSVDGPIVLPPQPPVDFAARE